MRTIQIYVRDVEGTYLESEPDQLCGICDSAISAQLQECNVWCGYAQEASIARHGTGRFVSIRQAPAGVGSNTAASYYLLGLEIDVYLNEP